MNTYVALLRGINVGGNNKIEMKRLKASFEALHFSAVATYINSGNVIFSSKIGDEKKLVKIIEKAIEETFGFLVQVVIRSAENIQKVAGAIPPDWKNDSGQKTDILFLWENYANKRSLKLIDATPEVDSLIYIDGAIIWHLEKKHYTKSGMNKFIGTELYKNMTARNSNTVRKLASLINKD